MSCPAVWRAGCSSATAVTHEPRLIIADEPTPGLDAKAAGRILGHFRELAEGGAGVLLITHDLELALTIADQVAVFYAGQTIEVAQAADFASPATLRHPFTRALWRAMPEHGFQPIAGAQPYPGTQAAGCPFAGQCARSTPQCREAARSAPAPLAGRNGAVPESAEGGMIMTLQANHVTFTYRGRHGAPVLENINLTIESGERVGLKAPSGRGKTTLCRLLAGYERPQSGQVLLDGQPVYGRKGVCPVQMMWQHPETVVDPLLRLGVTLEESGPVDRRLIEALHIEDGWLERFPAELSGGELQRFCLARALNPATRFLLCDEISAMLDLVTQAQIWNFLIREAERRDLGLLIVSHSDSLLEQVCTRIETLPA